MPFIPSWSASFYSSLKPFSTSKAMGLVDIAAASFFAPSSFQGSPAAIAGDLGYFGIGLSNLARDSLINRKIIDKPLLSKINLLLGFLSSGGFLASSVKTLENPELSIPDQIKTVSFAFASGLFLAQGVADASKLAATKLDDFFKSTVGEAYIAKLQKINQPDKICAVAASSLLIATFVSYGLGGPPTIGLGGGICMDISSLQINVAKNIIHAKSEYVKLINYLSKCDLSNVKFLGDKNGNGRFVGDDETSKALSNQLNQACDYLYIIGDAKDKKNLNDINNETDLNHLISVLEFRSHNFSKSPATPLSSSDKGPKSLISFERAASQSPFSDASTATRSPSPQEIVVSKLSLQESNSKWENMIGNKQENSKETLPIKH